MYGGKESLLILSFLVNCTLSSLAKSPNQCCKLSPEKPWVRHLQFTIYGIWLLLGKRDSPKFGHGCRTGKENDIRVFTGSGRVFSGSRTRLKYTAGFGKTPNFFTRYGNWPLPWWKRAGIRDQDPPTTSRLLVYSNPGSLLNILITNQTTYTYNPAQLSLIFYSTSR